MRNPRVLWNIQARAPRARIFLKHSVSCYVYYIHNYGNYNYTWEKCSPPLYHGCCSIVMHDSQLATRRFHQMNKYWGHKSHIQKKKAVVLYIILYRKHTKIFHDDTCPYKQSALLPENSLSPLQTALFQDSQEHLKIHDIISSITSGVGKLSMIVHY